MNGSDNVQVIALLFLNIARILRANVLFFQLHERVF